MTVPVAIFLFSTRPPSTRHISSVCLRNICSAIRIFLNKLLIETGTSYSARLAMALKIFETLPDVEGAVVECRTWKGGSAANLSIVCKIAGRKLIIFDSFDGLPEGKTEDRQGHNDTRASYRPLEKVKISIERYGVIDVCEFRRGRLNVTLSHLNEPLIMAFRDVDLDLSLEVCSRYIWPNLVKKGYIFNDEYVEMDFCTIFWSEASCKKYFDRT